MDPDYPKRSSEFYEAVGRALSTWQAVESQLSLIYVAVIGARDEPLAAGASFHAVTSLNTRIQMIEAAIAAKRKQPAVEGFSKLADRIRRASRNRNKLAHYMYNAVVDETGKVDIYLAHIGATLASPESAVVRHADIGSWRDDWQLLMMDATAYLVAQWNHDAERQR